MGYSPQGCKEEDMTGSPGLIQLIFRNHFPRWHQGQLAYLVELQLLPPLELCPPHTRPAPSEAQDGQPFPRPSCSLLAALCCFPCLGGRGKAPRSSLGTFRGSPQTPTYFLTISSSSCSSPHTQLDLCSLTSFWVKRSYPSGPVS